MTRRRRPTHEGARRLAERERAAGLDPDDAAARWLEAHDPNAAPAPPEVSQSARKSKLLHQWRQRQQRGP